MEEPWDSTWAAASSLSPSCSFSSAGASAAARASARRSRKLSDLSLLKEQFAFSSLMGRERLLALLDFIGKLLFYTHYSERTDLFQIVIRFEPQRTSRVRLQDVVLGLLRIIK